MPVLLILILLPVLSAAQISPPVSPKDANSLKGSPLGVDSVAVKYSRLMKIARKYGVAKNFAFRPALTNPSGKPPKTVYLKMSLDQFEDWMSQVAFQERKVKILNQFYLKDFQKVGTIQEYIALRRAYAKKYSIYLKDEESFQEAQILQEESHSGSIDLNTPNFRKNRINKLIQNHY